MGTAGTSEDPILAVDVDGVISLFGFEREPEDAPGRFQLVDGIPHYLSLRAGPRLLRLAEEFELVWATGWEDRANDLLPSILGIPELPVLHFGPDARFGSAHWKLGPLGEYGGDRPLAWIDDNLDESCHEWASRRAAPTLLVPTEPDRGIEEAHVEAILDWKRAGYTPS